jgi:hypothetical protein
MLFRKIARFILFFFSSATFFRKKCPKNLQKKNSLESGVLLNLFVAQQDGTHGIAATYIYKSLKSHECG